MFSHIDLILLRQLRSMSLTLFWPNKPRSVSLTDFRRFPHRFSGMDEYPYSSMSSLPLATQKQLLPPYAYSMTFRSPVWCFPAHRNILSTQEHAHGRYTELDVFLRTRGRSSFHLPQAPLLSSPNGNRFLCIRMVSGVCNSCFCPLPRGAPTQ